MQIDVLTLFPEMFDKVFSESIIGKAQQKDITQINCHNLRNWGVGNYKQVDDSPFGGGPGMVLMVEPIYNALKDLRKEDSWVIATSAKGRTLKQSMLKDLSEKNHVIIIAGHYEGFDNRVLENLVDDVVSIGNFVLTGGEIPAMAIIDGVIRLLPGALGNENSPETDSYYSDDKTRQFPQYTRPAEFKTEEGSILKIPDVLLSGNHKEIHNWRQNNTQLID